MVDEQKVGRSRASLALSSVPAGLSMEGASLVLATNEPEVLLTHLPSEATRLPSEYSQADTYVRL